MYLHDKLTFNLLFSPTIDSVMNTELNRIGSPGVKTVTLVLPSSAQLNPTPTQLVGLI